MARATPSPEALASTTSPAPTTPLRSMAGSCLRPPPGRFQRCCSSLQVLGRWPSGRRPSMPGYGRYVVQMLRLLSPDCSRSPLSSAVAVNGFSAVMLSAFMQQQLMCLVDSCSDQQKCCHTLSFCYSNSALLWHLRCCCLYAKASSMQCESCYTSSQGQYDVLQIFDGKDGRPKYPKRWIMLPPIF